MIKALIKPAVFVASIFVMAGIYELIWMDRPDYFRVASADVNVLPIDIVTIARDYSAFQDSKPIPKLRISAIEDAVSSIKSLYDRMQAASAVMADKKRELEYSERSDSEGYEAFERSQFAQVEGFVAAKGEVFQHQIETLDKRLEEILSSAGVQSAGDLPVGWGKVYYEETLGVQEGVRSDKLKAEVEARDYAGKHLTEFQRTPSQVAYLARVAATKKLSQEVLQEQDNIRTLHGGLYDAFVAYLDASHQKLSFGDFLYFSVGAATTATFGDIAPNHTIVRLMVCFQVLASVVFLGLMVNSIAGRAVKS